jgi:hypothetical protein
MIANPAERDFVTHITLLKKEEAYQAEILLIN